MPGQAVSRTGLLLINLGTPDEPTPSAVLRLPEWARKGSPLAPAARPLRMLLREQTLSTVCEEARCPNLGECFSRGTATFMLLGDRCTRRCDYCSVSTARPLPPDAGEPARVAAAAARLELRYVVLTAVARDDLRDGDLGGGELSGHGDRWSGY